MDYNGGILSPGGRLAAPAVLHPLWQADRGGAGRQLKPYHSHYMTSNSFIYFMDAQSIFPLSIFTLMAHI